MIFVLIFFERFRGLFLQLSIISFLISVLHACYIGLSLAIAHSFGTWVYIPMAVFVLAVIVCTVFSVLENNSFEKEMEAQEFLRPYLVPCSKNEPNEKNTELEHLVAVLENVGYQFDQEEGVFGHKEQYVMPEHLREQWDNLLRLILTYFHHQQSSEKFQKNKIQNHFFNALSKKEKEMKNVIAEESSNLCDEISADYNNFVLIGRN